SNGSSYSSSRLVSGGGEAERARRGAPKLTLARGFMALGSRSDRNDVDGRRDRSESPSLGKPYRGRVIDPTMPRTVLLPNTAAHSRLAGDWSQENDSRDYPSRHRARGRPSDPRIARFRTWGDMAVDVGSLRAHADFGVPSPPTCCSARRNEAHRVN